MSPLTITINNKSQADASYGIYAEPPAISPETSTTTRIITRVRGVASGSGQATFVLSKQLIATCGIYDINSDNSDTANLKKKPVGTGTEVVDQKLVDLGAEASNGTPIPGSCLEIDCANDTPSFVKLSTNVSVPVRSFLVKTRSDFTPQQASASRFEDDIT